MKKAIVQGREEKSEQVARKALAKGASVEFVQKITELDIEALEKLAAKNETPPASP